MALYSADDLCKIIESSSQVLSLYIKKDSIEIKFKDESLATQPIINENGSLLAGQSNVPLLNNSEGDTIIDEQDKLTQSFFDDPDEYFNAKEKELDK